MRLQQQPLTCPSSELPCDSDPHGSSAASDAAHRGLPTCAPQRPPCPQPTPAHQWPGGTPPPHQGMLWGRTSLLQSLQGNNQSSKELKDRECSKLVSFHTSYCFWPDFNRSSDFCSHLSQARVSSALVPFYTCMLSASLFREARLVLHQSSQIWCIFLFLML